MSKRKILIDGRLISSRPTGISRYCLELIKSYNIEYGEENVFVLSNRKNEKLFSNAIYTKYKPYNLLHFFLLTFWLKNSDFTLYHASTYSGLFVKLKSLPNVVTVHDVFYRIVPGFFSENVVVNFMAIVYYNLIVRASLNSASLIFAVSETTKADVDRFFNKKSIVIPEGVNRLSPPDLLNDRKEDFFLYVGNLRKQKNIKLLIDVFSSLPDQKLVICGNSGKVEADWLSILNIEFLGFVTDEELIHLYSTCKAFIFPSLYEGFGLPVLEALSLNSLVFSSTGGALKEFSNTNIYHFDPLDKKELVRLIKHAGMLSFDKDEAEVLLEQYSWKNVLVDMHKTIKSIHP